MKIIITSNAKEMGEKAADLIVKEIKNKPSLALGLATGKTMIPFYKALIKRFKEDKVNMSYVKVFQLDEYIGLSGKNKRSFQFFLKKHFLVPVNIPGKNIHFLNGNAKNLRKECKKYEKEIKKARDIDVQILGIGRNGHMGFNEPFSSFNSETRKVTLSDITRKDNAQFFNNRHKKAPKRALTMGIKTMNMSKKIILLAFGKNKAGIIHRALHGAIDEEIPASVLQKHKSLTVVIDKAAASELD